MEEFLIHIRGHFAGALGRIGRGRQQGLGSAGYTCCTPARLPDPQLSPGDPSAARGTLPTPQPIGRQTQPGRGAPPPHWPPPQALRAGSVRSGVAGTGKGRRTSDSVEVLTGVNAAGVVPPGIVPPGIVPPGIAMILPQLSGPLSPRQLGRGRWAGDWIPRQSGFRLLSLGPLKAGISPWDLEARGSPGGGRCRALCWEGLQRGFESRSRDKLSFNKVKTGRGQGESFNSHLNELICGRV